jgi:hypothetical protein
VAYDAPRRNPLKKAGDPMNYLRWSLFPLLFIAWCVEPGLMCAPQASSSETLIRSIADSSWNGAMGDVAKGNSPAQLRIVLQKGKLIGYLTYDDFEETLAVAVSARSKIQLKGVSVRDLQGAGRGFDLETLNAELSQDGRRLSGTTGTRSRFEFRRKS